MTYKPARDRYSRCSGWASTLVISFALGLSLATSSPAAGPDARPDDVRTDIGLSFAAFNQPQSTVTMTAHEAAQMIHWPSQNIQISAGLKIGMIDGGINLNHPALANQNIVARDFRSRSNRPVPLDHGTAVAALLIGDENSAEFVGLLPRATLYAANIFSRDRNGRILGDPRAFGDAVDWLIEMDVDVINVSLTGKHDPFMARAIEKAIDHGVLVVAAAGNNRGVTGRDFPGAYEGVLAATAVDAQFNIYEYASLGEHVDFSAPGVSLHMASADGGEVLSGTSFATPFLTAAAAIAIHDAGGFNMKTVHDILSGNARDLGSAGTDQVFGHGLIDCIDHSLQSSQPTMLSQIAPRGNRGVLAGPRELARN